MLAALALAALAGVSASPIGINVAEHIAPRALKETQQYLTIHESCNNTQRRMIERALK
jgi:microcompartment protein CcmL/EutN